MEFNEIEYQRPDVEKSKEEISRGIEAMKEAADGREQNQWITRINRLRRSYDTMENLCYIRHTIDTKDGFYDEEQEFFDRAGPEMAGIVQRFYQVIFDSEYLEELKTYRPRQFFDLAGTRLNLFKEEIVEEMQRENQLISAYDKVIASADIDFDGKKLSLAQLGPYLTHQDRGIRKASHEAFSGFMASREAEFDGIFDELVQLRHRMALKLGYRNFVGMGYDRLGRTDYSPAEVAKFREAVHREITPLSSALMKRQKERIGVDSLLYYDLNFAFKSGNPRPQGEADEIVAGAFEMYNELSLETRDFFKRLMEGRFMDLKAKKSKAAGGYCTFLKDIGMPFIFSNFNGTHSDVSVLTHEFGHAFQVYSGRNIEELELIWPTYEAAEIFSMGMEFMTWPWMEKFFGDDEERFRFLQLQNALTFIPYGAAVDEFQHQIYENPQMTPSQRKQTWRGIEKKYMPYIDYGSNESLEGGSFWHKQGHVFQVPFYYIDYALAQISAFELLHRYQKDPGAAWQDYLNMCHVSGSRSYTGILKEGGLSNPFVSDHIRSIIKDVEGTMRGFDDRKF
jgi:M3 family oligoendopeptidase